MQGVKIRELIYELAREAAEKNGLELIGVEYVKEGANWYLRLYIDKEGGVDHEDCKTVSEIVSELLDKKDPIPSAYFLEVSSPGVERIIQTERDFEKYRGRAVHVHTYNALNGQKKFSGILMEKKTDFVLLQSADGTEQSIPTDKIARVKLAWEK